MLGQRGWADCWMAGTKSRHKSRWGSARPVARRHHIDGRKHRRGRRWLLWRCLLLVLSKRWRWRRQWVHERERRPQIYRHPYGSRGYRRVISCKARGKLGCELGRLVRKAGQTRSGYHLVLNKSRLRNKRSVPLIWLVCNEAIHSQVRSCHASSLSWGVLER